MQYMGSKRRIAKYILPIILKNRKEGQWYVEPFVGGCNSIDKVDGNRIGNDYNYYLIQMWKDLQKSWLPPTSISEEEYKRLKIKAKQNIKDNEASLIGFAGVGASFGAKWFGGFARGKKGESGLDSKKSMQNFRNVSKQVPFIREIEFYCGSYDELKIPKNSIIYCDPPYIRDYWI